MHAISGIDIALWDIPARPGPAYPSPPRRRQGRALPDLCERPVARYDRGQADLAQRHRAAGFRAMKFGSGGLGRGRPDMPTFRRSGVAVGDEMDIMVDIVWRPL